MTLEGLKELITSNIKPNNNREITGQVLQDTLVQMADTLGTVSGSFRGLARKETNPGESAEGDFYLAVVDSSEESENFANFGLSAVNRGLSLLTYDGSKWKNAALVSVQNTEITADADKEFVPTVKAVYEFGEKIKGEKGSSASVMVYKNYGLDAKGDLTVRQGLSVSGFMPLAHGKDFKATVYGVDNSISAVVLYDKDFNFVKKFSGSEDPKTDVVIQSGNIPENAVFFRVCSSSELEYKPEILAYDGVNNIASAVGEAMLDVQESNNNRCNFGMSWLSNLSYSSVRFEDNYNPIITSAPVLFGQSLTLSVSGLPFIEDSIRVVLRAKSGESFYDMGYSDIARVTDGTYSGTVSYNSDSGFTSPVGEVYIALSKPDSYPDVEEGFAIVGARAALSGASMSSIGASIVATNHFFNFGAIVGREPLTEWEILTEKLKSIPLGERKTGSVMSLTIKDTLYGLGLLPILAVYLGSGLGKDWYELQVRNGIENGNLISLGSWMVVPFFYDVNNLIDKTIGDINTILDNINGEVI